MARISVKKAPPFPVGLKKSELRISFILPDFAEFQRFVASRSVASNTILRALR